MKYLLKFHIFTIPEEIVSFQAQKELVLKSKTESENIKQQNQKLQVCLLGRKLIQEVG